MNRNTKWVGVTILVATLVVTLSFHLAAKPAPSPSPQTSPRNPAVASAEPTLLALASPSPSPAPQNSPSSQPKITWSVPELSASMFPGTTSTTSVSFRSNQDISGVVVEMTASLNGMVSVSPFTFASITANQTYQLTLMLFAPPAFIKRNFGGTIHLRNSDQPPRTYDTPLAVNLRTEWNAVIDHQSGLTLALPEVGVPVLLNNLGPTPDTLFVLDIQISNVDGTASSLIRLPVFANPSLGDLATWFHQHVDPNGILISSGTFQQQSLPNGFLAFVKVGPVPDSYTDGPVAEGYAMMPTRDRIIAIIQSQDAQLTEYGYAASAIPSVLKSILVSCI